MSQHIALVTFLPEFGGLAFCHYEVTQLKVGEIVPHSSSTLCESEAEVSAHKILNFWGFFVVVTEIFLQYS